MQCIKAAKARVEVIELAARAIRGRDVEWQNLTALLYTVCQQEMLRYGLLSLSRNCLRLGGKQVYTV